MFNFQAVYDNDLTDVVELSSNRLQLLDGEMGNISHLLINPSTNRAEWAILVDKHAEYHLIPTDLIEVDEEDETQLRCRLLQDAVRSHLKFADPETLNPVQLAQATRDAMSGLVDAAKAGVSYTDRQLDRQLADVETSLTANTGHYLVNSLKDIAGVISRRTTLEEALPGAHSGFGGGVDAGSDERRGDRDDGGATETTDRAPAEWGYNSAVCSACWYQGDGPPLRKESEGEAVRGDSGPEEGRSLIAELPRTVRLDTRFSVQVQINEFGDIPSTAYSTFLPIGGGTITINATAPQSFEVNGELTQDITVPTSGNSDPILFNFTPRAIGTFPLRFTAFAGGSYLGVLNTEISVSHEASGAAPPATATLSAAPPQPGEVSLQITFDELSRTFQFLFVSGGDWRPVPSKPIQGELRPRLEALIAELDRYAAREAGISEAEAQQRIRIRGFELWRDLVPDEIKSAIFKHLDKITQLTIISDREIIPWELLYPQSPTGDEPGFLVSLFPLNRWILATPWSRTLSLQTPSFVVPDNSPKQASDEVRAIGRSLSSADAPTVRSKQQLLAALVNPTFDLLHFACHNTFSMDQGSQIKFPDAPLAPSDLALHAAKKPLQEKSSLVFINACRTQGTTPTYTAFENWAKSFLELGATAVIGTSWAVRDRTARPFAEAVYEQLVAGQTLGQSVAAARARVSTTLGDPTWLAYTVYGDPNARVESR